MYQEHGESLADLVEQIKAASADLAAGDARTNKRIDELAQSINALYLKHGRPGVGWDTKDDEVAERKSAVEHCHVRHALQVPKTDGRTAYVPAAAEVEEALTFRKALRSVWRTGNTEALDPAERKSLSSFSFGTNQFILPPELSDRVLSCVVDPTDVAGIVGNVTTSSASIKFLIDNVRMGIANWACEASCFSNKPQPDLQAGLG